MRAGWSEMTRLNAPPAAVARIRATLEQDAGP